MLTVVEVADRLGPALVVARSGRLSATVADVAVTDPAFPVAPPRGALVVAPGYRLGDAGTDELLEAAGVAGAAGVVVKGTTVQADRPSGSVALLVVEPSADWAHLVALLRTLTTTGAGPLNPEDSLFGLADAIASLCGGPVVLHDPAWQLLAYSGGRPTDDVRSETILGRRAPAQALEQLRAAGILDRLMRGDMVEIAAGAVANMGRRYAVAARAGSELLATIWLQPEEDRPDTDVEQRLRWAADVAAVSLLRHAAAGPGGVGAADAAFDALLSGSRTERIVAERLGVAVDSGFVLAGLRPMATEERDRAATARRLMALARGYCDAYRVQARVAAGADTAYLLFCCAEPDQRRSAVRIVSDMHARLQSAAPHRALLSSTFPSLVETPSVRQSVDQLLALAERRGWSGLTDSEHVQASFRLEQFREVALAHPALLAGPVVTLAEHDRAQGSDLVTTLRAYFANVGDMKAAGAQLGLHVNTVRYRITKAQEIGGFSLDNPDERLLAELQVRLLT
ncbi:MAG TPA: helix-turn-helix domain-containing protein [Mycobacteriales bacterium]|nr:helix-turn-helix domain-containing protein [Mycobacteriales bacterium]